MWVPAGSVERSRIAVFDKILAEPMVVAAEAVVSKKVIEPCAFADVIRVAVRRPLPYAVMDGPAIVSAPGTVVPRPAIVWMVASAET